MSKTPAKAVSERSPERQELARRIALRNEAQEQHGKLVKARSRLNLEALADAQDEAEVNLRKEQEESPARYNAGLLSGESAAAVPSVAEAEKTLATATAAYDQARAAQQLLDAEIETTARRIAGRDSDIRAQVGAVLQSEPAVAGLLAAYYEANIQWSISPTACRRSAARAEFRRPTDIGMCLVAIIPTEVFPRPGVRRSRRSRPILTPYCRSKNKPAARGGNQGSGCADHLHPVAGGQRPMSRSLTTAYLLLPQGAAVDGAQEDRPGSRPAEEAQRKKTLHDAGGS